jgi:hypothetical protein
MANIDQLYKFTFCKIRTIQELVNEGEPPILDEEVLKKKVLSEMPKKLPIFSQKPPTLDELVQIAKEMGVILSYKMANQALYYARDYSSNDKKFDTYSLVKWFSDNISMLRSIEHGNNFRATHRSNYEKSQPTVKIFGATLGFGGYFGSRANQVANQIFSPSQTLQTVQLNDISNSTLPRQMN